MELGSSGGTDEDANHGDREIIESEGREKEMLAEVIANRNDDIATFGQVISNEMIFLDCIYQPIV